MNPDRRNTLSAFLLIGVILILWEAFYISPRREQQVEITDVQTTAEQTTTEASAPSSIAGKSPVLSPLDQAPVTSDAPHITFTSPSVRASLNLRGGRLDSAQLARYRVEKEDDSPLVDVLNSTSTSRPYYSHFGWSGDADLPDFNTLWEARQPDRNSDIFILSWTNSNNVTFEQEWSLVDDYLFQIELRVVNRGSDTITIAPYGLIARASTPETENFYILHEGLIGAINETLVEVGYEDIRDEKRKTYEEGANWLGITDKYWLTALIPDQSESNVAHFAASPHVASNDSIYQADYILSAATLAPGQRHASVQRLFVGAKEVPVLERYKDMGIPLFDRAVDFGWYYFLTKPIFNLLHWIALRVENFGIAIIVLTILVRLLLFPLAQRSYTSMSKMKKLSPNIAALRELHAGDRQKLSSEMMLLYRREKINPLAGCLPIVLQIPIFFCLYKVLFVTIEMRHAPFFGWITDLSAPDPSGVLTIFGLATWSIPPLLTILNVGIWPILMGTTMFLQMKLNPTPADPIQKKIFTYMPIAFTFFLGQFPAGLVIYWTVSNTLSMLQQWVIMRRMGVKIG